MMRLDYWLQDTVVPWQQYQPKISEIHHKLNHKEDAYTGWMDWPARVEDTLVQEILSTADEIRI